MIGENNSAQAPTPNELMQWANSHGANHPIVVDPGFNQTVQYLYAAPGFNGSFYLPNMQLLSPGMVVEKSNTQLQLNQVLAHLP